MKEFYVDYKEDGNYKTFYGNYDMCENFIEGLKIDIAIDSNCTYEIVDWSPQINEEYEKLEKEVENLEQTVRIFIDSINSMRTRQIKYEEYIYPNELELRKKIAISNILIMSQLRNDLMNKEESKK